jgi:hypothetical protein
MADFHEEMDRLQGHMPGWANRHLNRLRQPRAVWVRVPAGIALAGGGVFSVLPVLGLWMVPVGLALLAQDVPPMRKPMARVLRFTNGKIDDMKARKAANKEKARKAYDAMKAYNEAKKARERAAPKGKAAAGRKHVAAAAAKPGKKGPPRP